MVDQEFFKADRGYMSSEEEYCSWVNNQAIKHPVVTAHHGKWKELIEWELGNQFSLWSGADSAVMPVTLRIRKKMIVINLMKPLNETIEGKLNFDYHIIGVPNSGERKDVRGAQVATKLIDYNDYVNGIEELMEEMKYDLLRPSISCIKWMYDKNAVGALSKKGNKIPGEVIGEVVPIFNIRPDPVAKTKAQMRWIVELKEVTKQAVSEAFPDLSDETIDGLSEAKDKKQEGRYVRQEEVDKDEDTLILKELWARPCELYEKGRLIYSCHDKVLEVKDNPSPDHDIPHFFFFYKKSPYSFWPRGPLHFVQDIQREFNRMISIRSEHHEAWRPKMAVGKGALLRANSMTVDSFELVEVDFNKGGPPVPIRMPELSTQLLDYIHFLEGSIDKVSNVHEVSYARLPQYASRAPASLYSMMLEQENVKLSSMVKRINKTLQDMAKFRLKLMDKHYTHPRLVKIMGEDKSASIEYFEKADLNQNFDVRLERGVSLNQSATIQQRLMLELWNAKILGPEDRRKIKRMIFEGSGAEEIRADLADSDKAQRENQAFLDKTHKNTRQKGGVAVYMHDDHELHMDSHTDFIKSEEGQQLDDTTYKELSLHIEEHFVYLQRVMAAMQQAQMLSGQGQGGQQMAEERMGGTPGPEPGQAGSEGFPQ